MVFLYRQLYELWHGFSDICFPKKILNPPPPKKKKLKTIIAKPMREFQEQSI